MDYPKRVAIIRLSAMGDIIHTLASVQFIKSTFPNIHLTWFVDEVFEEILKYNPQIDQIISLPLKELKKSPTLKSIKSIYKKVKSAGEFDLIIDVQGLIKSAIISKLIGKNIIGLDFSSAREPIASLFYKHKIKIDCKEIAPFRFANLISKALNFEITKEMLKKKSAFLFWDNSRDYSKIDDFFQTQKKSIILVIGASNPSKIYPKTKWLEVISHLRMYNILIVAGSEKEIKMAKEIEQNSVAKLLPKMNLNDLKYSISKVNLLIGNDTGPSHIAWGLNRPSIVLFGSTPKTMMMESDKNIAISVKDDFKACRFDKSDMSIQQIKPKEIVQKAKELLDNE